MRTGIYDRATGRIVMWASGPEAELQDVYGGEFGIFKGCPKDATHIINGEPVTEPLPPPTVEEMAAAVTTAVQRHLDLTARSHGYDSILSLASYATSTDPIFRAEGEAGTAWRDACWRACYQGFAEVKAGLRPMPTVEEAIAALPVFVWPTV